MLGIDIVTSAELCPTAENPDQIIRDMKKWIKEEGFSDLEPVSLFAEQLEKVRYDHSHLYKDDLNR